MWDAFRSDLLLFVETVTDDTTRTVKKVLGEGNEDDVSVDEELIQQEKIIADLKRSHESYANPIKKKNEQEYLKYLKKFKLEEFAG